MYPLCPKSATTAGLLLAVALPGLAAPRLVGTAVAHGDFRMDGTTVMGNATVLEGSALETAGVASTIRLSQGGAVTLGEAAKVKMYGDRMVLERGIGQVSGTTRYPIEVQKLLVQPAEGSQARVKLEGGAKVLVAALRGPVRVSTVNGIIVANVVPGAAMSFMQTEGATAATTVHGTLTKSGNTYLLRDRTTSITFQITGCNDVTSMLSKNVTVTGLLQGGVTPAAGTSQVLQASCSNIQLGTSSAASAASSGSTIGGTKAASAGMGILGGHSAAVITGVVVAAAGVGIGLGVELSNDGQTTSR